MKNANRFLSGVMAAVLMLLCAACGNTAAVQQEAPPSAGPTETATATAAAITELVKPEAAQYPKEEDFIKDGEYDWDAYDKAMDAWFAEREARSEAIGRYAADIDAYMAKAPAVFLAGAEGQNAICSPLNIYMALAMLAECTAGDTQAQILELLGAADLAQLRTTAQALWEANYRNDGLLTELLGSSLWLNQNISFNKETINNLALYYYATAYQGDMTDAKFFEAFQNWLDEQTAGLLKEQISTLEPFKPEDVMAIATTIYFKGTWYNEFQPELNTSMVFHGADGDNETVFMCSDDKGTLYKGEGFRAVRLAFKGDAAMWILLPEEGTSPEDLITNGAAAKFLEDPDASAEGRYVIHLKLPKFDVSSSLSLKEALMQLGVTDAFDKNSADFTPLTDTPEVFVSSVTHDARVKID